MKKSLKIAAWVGGTLFVLAIIGSFLYDPYKEGMDYYNSKSYEKALKQFQSVRSSDEHYADAQAKILELTPIVDSLRAAEKAKKDEDDRLRQEEEKMKKEKTEKEKQEAQTEQKEKQPIEEQKPEQSSTPIEPQSEKSTSTVPSINNDLKTKISESVQGIGTIGNLLEKPHTSLQDFIISIAVLKAYATQVNEGKQSTDKETIALAQKLHGKLTDAQKKYFPKLRKDYFNFARETLWEKDIDVEISGVGNTVLKFTGGIYAANKNIKQTQEAVLEMITLLRYKQTQYRWYKGQDEFQYYNITSAKDGDIVD